ncbi:MAG TPA: hypothetical protein VFC23_18010 [Thermoanaerobaculia bacterium]|nr:hypothetical protein [Thermoanaerobaculia bacterium]
MIAEVAASIQMKARDDERLRAEVARDQAERLAGAAAAIRQRVARGGKLILSGNGGSATDANDWALEEVQASLYHVMLELMTEEES